MNILHSAFQLNIRCNNQLNGFFINLFIYFFNEINSYETRTEDRNRNADCNFNFEIIFFIYELNNIK